MRLLLLDDQSHHLSFSSSLARSLAEDSNHGRDFIKFGLQLEESKLHKYVFLRRVC